MGLKAQFLQHCSYHSGQYDSAEDFAKLDEELKKKEDEAGASKGGSSGSSGTAANRIFYMAIPPDAFVGAAKSVEASAMSKRGWNRVIVEKPFGRDTESSAQLGKELNALFSEDQIYRIDHYLGKEVSVHCDAVPEMC